MRLALAKQLADLEIAALSRHLEAIDQAIRLHQIMVDPIKLASTRVQANPRRSGYGGMTAASYGALKRAAPKALTTDQVLAFVIGTCDFGPVPEDYSRRPIDLAVTANGALMVRTLLDRMEHGVYM
jgi:hypothetical protein